MLGRLLVNKACQRQHLFKPIKNWFMLSVRISSYGCTREVWRARIARGAAESNSSFLSALQTSRHFPSNLNVSLDFVSGNIEILGKQNSLFPSGPVIKCLLFPKGPVIKICYIAKQNERTFWITRWDSSNSGQHFAGNSELSFPFDDIVFAMLPAHGIWRETVSLLDVMWPWTSQWVGAV